MYGSQPPYNDQSVINDVLCARSVLVSELPKSDFWPLRSSFGSENKRQHFSPIVAQFNRLFTVAFNWTEPKKRSRNALKL